jgi:hypothetical protein
MAFSLSFIAGLVCGVVGGLMDAANAMDETTSPSSNVARIGFEWIVFTGTPVSVIGVANDHTPSGTNNRNRGG